MARKLNHTDPSDRITDGSMVAFGENPNGMTAVTPNGVAHDRGEGANHQWNFGPGINGPRWEMPPPEVEVLSGLPVTGAMASGPTKRNGTKARNRTGE